MLCKKMLKTTALLSTVALLSACSNGVNKNNYNRNLGHAFMAKEKLYQQTQNYGGLVDLYRGALKKSMRLKFKTDPELLYRLSEAYYKKGDYLSALTYLNPLLEDKNYLERAMLLKVQSLVKQNKEKEAINTANVLLQKFPNNANAYNSRGIAYAQLGLNRQAEADFLSARAHFLNDVTAINNLAMLNILEGQYKNAVRLLLPQYLNGVRDTRLMHNLVFALVKSGDLKYAQNIVEKEGLNTLPSELINALKQTKRLPTKVHTS